MIHVLMISGGKDSAALWSWAKRANLTPRIALTQDTGWEWSGWRAYLDELAAAIGEPTRIVKAETDFAARVRKHNTFPGRVNRRRWCTPELKLEPAKMAIDQIREETGEDVTVVVGIRGEESEKRAAMPEREWSDFYDCEVWRPLINWTLADVMREHHENGLPINPLYKRGHERVGCYPCIKANKAEIRLISENDPERIDEIRALEEETGNRMFCLERSKAGRKGLPREMIPKPIDEIVAWSKTKRGGLRLAVVHEPTGCARWGLCEPPTPEPVMAKAIPPKGQRT